MSLGPYLCTKVTIPFGKVSVCPKGAGSKEGGENGTGMQPGMAILVLAAGAYHSLLRGASCCSGQQARSFGWQSVGPLPGKEAPQALASGETSSADLPRHREDGAAIELQARPGSSWSAALAHHAEGLLLAIRLQRRRVSISHFPVYTGGDIA